MQIDISLNDPEFLAGIVIARGVTVAPSPAPLAQLLDELVTRRAVEDFPPPALKDAVRGMLRKGGFRPAGRNKPASEYLAQAAREGRFPRISNLVDINNLISLQTGLPISMLDLDSVGDGVEIRYGRAGEKYIFNPAGQEIDLAGLICICRADATGGIPLGTPIKDSIAGKIKEHTKNVIGVIYATMRAVDEAALQAQVAEFAAMVSAHSAARQVEHRVDRGTL